MSAKIGTSRNQIPGAGGNPAGRVTPSARILPNNLEAEQSVLGCVLIDNDACIGGLLRLTEADFYSPSHKIIFSAMKGLAEKNQPADFVTLVEALSSTGNLESVGGLQYITQLTDIVPSSSAFKHYVNILKKNRVHRKLITTANQIIEQSYTAEDEQQALAMAEKAIFDISREDEKKELTPLQSELPAVLERLDTIQRDPAAVKGLKTGFGGLDNLTNGLQKSDLVILAARPSVGKTSLALNIITNIALKGGKCAIFSLEMSKRSLTMRALCSVAGVSLSKANKGELDNNEWQRIFDANRKLSNSNIYIDDNSVITPAEITRKCMRLKREQGLDIVMIDYLGLMGGGGRRESRQVEVADNSRMIKIMAKELDVPVILLSQLNRGIESRKGTEGKPMLSDLRESGAIEQDADIVLFIHKEKSETEGEGSEAASKNAPQEVELIIAKHRNGPLGNIKLQWIGEWTSFRNMRTEQLSQEAREKHLSQNNVTNQNQVMKKEAKQTDKKQNPEQLSNIGSSDSEVF